METMEARFIRYCKINTRSDEQSETIPSTAQQVIFAKNLYQELIDLGFAEVTYSEDSGFVMASVLANTDQPVPTIGFIAHYDTADFNSENIQPQKIENYQATDVVLNENLGIVMQVADFPNLRNYRGHDLIVTDGTTLLGADDKAGIVEIIEAMLYLMKHPEIKHGKIRMAFGPDEEIGRGADHFDVEKFGADFAYTMDGSRLGELQYESFNAAAATVYLKGVSVHPGTAKNKMINTAKLAIEFDQQLPAEEVPEMTEHYEGFYLLSHLETTVEEGKMTYIIRDHDRKLFEQRKQKMLDIASSMNNKYQRTVAKVDLFDQYYNMGEIISKDMRSVNLAKQAMEALGIKPLVEPIRGGTDGSKISFMGVPTPNIFVGAENFHGKYEFASLNDMQKAVEVIVKIAELNAQ